MIIVFKFILVYCRGEQISMVSMRADELIKIFLSVRDGIMYIKLTRKGNEKIKTKIEIIYNHKIIKTRGFSSDDLWTIEIVDFGMYLVRVWVMIDDEFLSTFTQKSIRYYSNEMKEKYNNFIKSINIENRKTELLPLYNLRKPYQNMALIYLQKYGIMEKSIMSHIGNINAKLKLNIIMENTNEIIIAISQMDLLENSIIFSGKTKYEKKLILGQEDLKAGMDFHKLLNEIGIYTAIYKEEEKIIFKNDYFGMYRIYMYHDKNVAVIGNNYHLCLLILKSIRMNLEFDIDETLPYLMYGERMFTEQRITHKMDVKGIEQLPITKYVVITKQGISVKNKNIADILDNSIDFCEKGYKYYLQMAAREIIDNIELVIKDERFENVIVDVTGGKDSRTVLAALTNVDQQYLNKVRINSKDVINTNDKKVFIGLNNLCGYKYDDLTAVYEMELLEEKEYRNRSFFMGNSYSRPFPWELSYDINAKENKYIRLTGAGEVILRATMAAYFPNLPYDSGCDEMLQAFLVSFENSIIDTEKCRCEVKKQINLVLDEIMGQSLKERFNNHYLYFRNVYHFGMETIMDCQEGVEQWQPLWSSNALKAFKMTFGKFNYLKFQMDLIAELNPILVHIPFENEADNKQIESMGSVGDLRYANMEFLLDSSESDWKMAQEKKQNNRKIINSEESERIEAANKKYLDTFYDNFEQVLKKLLKYENGKYGDLVGLDLFYYLDSERGKYKNTKSIPRSSWFIYNKLCSIVDQIDIIQN